MVEGQHLVEEEQAGVGNAEFVLGQHGQALDLADGVVRKKAHRSGGKGRQPWQARGLVAAERAAQHGEDVALDLDDLLALGDGDLAPARDDALEGLEADEGVAAHLLAVLDRFEHESTRAPARRRAERPRPAFPGRRRGCGRREQACALWRAPGTPCGWAGRNWRRLSQHQCNCSGARSGCGLRRGVLEGLDELSLV